MQHAQIAFDSIAVGKLLIEWTLQRAAAAARRVFGKRNCAQCGATRLPAIFVRLHMSSAENCNAKHVAEAVALAAVAEAEAAAK